jgi:peptidoglycan/LPS O-acetylase OafA/YrhL
MPETRRAPVLEGARGIVVTAIVGYHALRLVLERQGGDWGDVSPMWWWAGTGRLGVDAFFVLAGYLVVASWESCRRHARTTTAAVGEFARRRGWRILPPYLVMLVVVVPLAAPELLAPGHAADLLQLLTVQQYLDPDLPGQVNLPIWSLTTEVHFYVVAPIAAWALRRIGGWPVVAGALALSVWWTQLDDRGDLSAGLLPGRLDQFLVGAATGAVIVAWQAGVPSRAVDLLTRRGALPALLTALLAVGTYHGAVYRSGEDGLLAVLVHPVAGVLLAGVLVRLVCGPRVSALEHPALVWLGGISFSVYLWHYPILQHGLRQVHPSQPIGLVALVAALLVVAGVVVAAFFRDLVERPVRNREEGRRSTTRPSRPVPARVPEPQPVA